MRVGKPFEVPKEVFDRAKANYRHQEGYAEPDSYYMTNEDKKKYFSEAILCGYGLYSCKIHEEDGKYICTYSTGDSCD